MPSRAGSGGRGLCGGVVDPCAWNCDEVCGEGQLVSRLTLVVAWSEGSKQPARPRHSSARGLPWRLKGPRGKKGQQRKDQRSGPWRIRQKTYAESMTFYLNAPGT